MKAKINYFKMLNSHATIRFLNHPAALLVIFLWPAGYCLLNIDYTLYLTVVTIMSAIYLYTIYYSRCMEIRLGLKGYRLFHTCFYLEEMPRNTIYLENHLKFDSKEFVRGMSTRKYLERKIKWFNEDYKKIAYEAKEGRWKGKNVVIFGTSHPWMIEKWKDAVLEAGGEFHPINSIDPLAPMSKGRWKREQLNFIGRYNPESYPDPKSWKSYAAIFRA